MLERFVHVVSCADGGNEDTAATRERLKDRFPRGATRRMTQLGMLIGTVLEDVHPRSEDALVYASGFAETRALEGYLDSFPAASPTLFQTSIHPSAVQQALIGQQRPVQEFFPLTGRAYLVAHALQAAALCPASRVLLCGGEERGTWLLEQRAASDRTFAFALSLETISSGAVARVTLTMTAPTVTHRHLTLLEFYNALRDRQAIDVVAAPGIRVNLRWTNA
jgi:hypothetical protein